MSNSEYLPDASEQRPPPHSIEAEQGVLGCIFLSPPECLAECIEKLRAGALAFYDLKHQLIYSVLVAMFEKQEAVDVITVQQRLRDGGTLEQVGGIAYLASLPDTVPGAANLAHYLKLVQDKYRLRRVLATCHSVVGRVYDHAPEEMESLLARVAEEFEGVAEVEGTATEEHIRTVMHRVVNNLEERHYERGHTQLRGLPTGPEGNYLDKVIQGIRPTHYVVLAGRPGSGKTSLAMNLVEFWSCDFVWWQPLTFDEAKKLEFDGEKISVHENEGQEPRYYLRRVGIPVCVFSIEMDSESLVERMLFGRAGIDQAQYAQGFAGGGTENVTRKITVAAGKLGAAPIYIVSEPGQNVSKMAAQARRMVKQYGLKGTPSTVPPMVFILDYIQLATTDDERDDSRQRVSKISKKIMTLKKRLKCPWIVLAQMNRNIETSERDRKPVLSDLKESGDLEQDADVVQFTHKTSVKECEMERNGRPSDKDLLEAWAERKKVPWSQVPYRVDIVVPKNRFGPTGEVQMVFQKNLCRFEDWHLFKVRNELEDLKAGEREKVVKPRQDDIDYGD